MNLTLNVGCGTRTFKEYPTGYKCINYDERELDVVDVVGDVRKLSFPDKQFSYILASDIIEHFPVSEINNILTEWKRVLIIGGVIEFRLPDLEAICKSYVSGQHDAKLTSWLLYGGQDYPGNFHYTAFDRKSFNDILTPLGFKELEFKHADNNFEIKLTRVV